MTKEIELLGKFTVTLPPGLKGTSLISYLLEEAEGFAEDDGYTVASVVPLKKRDGAIDILIYVYGE